MQSDMLPLEHLDVRISSCTELIKVKHNNLRLGVGSSRFFIFDKPVVVSSIYNMFAVTVSLDINAMTKLRTFSVLTTRIKNITLQQQPDAA